MEREEPRPRREVGSREASGGGRRGVATPDTAPPLDGRVDLPSDPDSLPEGATAVCRSVADALVADLDVLTDRMTDAVRRQVADYARLDGRDADYVRQTVRTSAELFVAVLRGHRLDVEELGALQAVGAERARQGLGLEAVIEAPWVAMQVGYEHLLATIDRFPSSPDHVVALGALAGWLSHHVQRVQAALARGFLDQQERATLQTADDRREAVALLLAGNGDALAESGPAEALGIDAGVPGALVVAAPRPRDGQRLTVGKAVTVLQSVAGAVLGPTHATPIPHVAALVPGDAVSSWRDVVKRLRTSATEHDVVVVIERVDPLDTAGRCYRLAREQLDLVDVVTGGPGVVEVDDVLPYWLVAGAPRGLEDDVLARILGPLLDDQRAPRLLATLRTYFSCGGDRERTAKACGVNEKTVRRHLQAVLEITGRSPSEPGDVCLLYQGLRLLELRSAGRWRSVRGA